TPAPYDFSCAVHAPTPSTIAKIPNTPISFFTRPPAPILPGKKALAEPPDFRHRRRQLMVVIHQVQFDVRPCLRPSLHHRGIDRRVPATLNDEDRQLELKRKGVILRGVFVESESDLSLFVPSVVKHPNFSCAPPGVDPVLAEVSKPVAAKI